MNLLSLVKNRVAPLAATVSVALYGAFLGACSDTPVSLPLRSLERSGEVSFLCLSADDRDNPGRDIDECPDFDFDDDENYRLVALVTQTVRGEVAVVDVSAGGGVVDVNPAIPGFDFLPVGNQPGDIVSTPGGVASFVGVTEAGKEGIYALPSSCVGAPRSDEAPRELVTWPACALPSRPGEMTILIDPPVDAGDGPRLRSSCDGSYDLEVGSNEGFDPGRELCLADLSQETNPPGRRVLAVALPDRGEIAMIDAQELLNRPQGSFDPCPVERWVPLQIDLPSDDIAQQLPDDLQTEDPACQPQGFNHGPEQDTFVSRPATFSLAEDTLYIADRGAPVIHRMDVSDPCAPVERKPLLPVAFGESGRTVFTTDVAVGPVLTDGSRVAYAIDEERGSVMVFDVSLNASNRTPLVRERSAFMPFEPADRISFDAPARAVEIVLRDEAIVDPNTGVATVGTRCNPDPDIDDESPPAEYRPNTSLTSGASPRKLRGAFGFVALTSGQVAVIDIEDFDEPCRRPTVTNVSSQEDFRGCTDGEEVPAFYTEDKSPDGIRTVTDEDTCNIVRPHRARSASFFKTSSTTGVGSAALRALPRLSKEETTFSNNRATEEGAARPTMLAVDFPDGKPAQVYVGTRLHHNGDEGDEVLDVNPLASTRSSLALNTREPRAFPPNEEFALVYEGSLFGERGAGFLQEGGTELTDSGGLFCDRGVQDTDLAAEFALQELDVEDDDVRAAFGERHADFVLITSNLPGEDDSHWDQGVGLTCGGGPEGTGFFACRSTFGIDLETATSERELRIDEAYQGRLSVSPRNVSGGDASRVREMLRCCFPGAVKYEVRGGKQWVLRGSSTGFQHKIERGEGDRCSWGCNVFDERNVSRVVEVSCQTAEVCDGKIGFDPEAVVCNQSVGGVGPNDPCVLENLTQRFAVYRGFAESERDMTFSWQVTGGFVPLSASLRVQSSAVSPISMQFVPQLGQLAVTDGSTQGLLLVSLTSVRVSRLFF